MTVELNLVCVCVFVCLCVLCVCVFVCAPLGWVNEQRLSILNRGYATWKREQPKATHTDTDTDCGHQPTSLCVCACVRVCACVWCVRAVRKQKSGLVPNSPVNLLPCGFCAACVCVKTELCCCCWQTPPWVFPDGAATAIFQTVSHGW